MTTVLRFPTGIGSLSQHHYKWIDLACTHGLIQIWNIHPGHRVMPLSSPITPKTLPPWLPVEIIVIG